MLCYVSAGFVCITSGCSRTQKIASLGTPNVYCRLFKRQFFRSNQRREALRRGPWLLLNINQASSGSPQTRVLGCDASAVLHMRTDPRTLYSFSRHPFFTLLLAPLKQECVFLTRGGAQRAPAGPPAGFHPDEGQEEWPTYLQIAFTPIRLQNAREHLASTSSSPRKPQTSTFYSPPGGGGGQRHLHRLQKCV